VRVTRMVWMVVALFAVTCSHRPPRLDAVVSGIGGHALIQRSGGEQWVALDTGNAVELGDSIRVLSDSYLELAFGEGNTIRLNENTEVHFSAVEDSQGNAGIEVYDRRGAVTTTITELPEPYALYQVRTPDAVAVAGGTQFCVTYEVSSRNAEVVVISGEVWVMRPDEDPEPVIVESGHYVVVPLGMPLSPPARLGVLHRRRVESLMAPPVPVRRIARVAPPGPRKPARMKRPQKRGPRRPLRPALRPGPGKHRPKPGPGRPAVVKKPRPAGPKRVGKPAAPRRSTPRPAARPGPAPRPKSRPAVRRGPSRPHRPAAARPGPKGPAAKRKAGGPGKKPKKDESGKKKGPGKRR
jgi:hypothetical protein